MILDELVLHNFGVYRGRQRFELTPEGPERPIILVGAQNGAGKTTFLEGLQLAFFGRLADSGLRGGASYEEYLRRAINRGVPAQEGAEVQVTFRRTLAGREQVFTIRRAWSIQKGAVREIFEAVVDGKLDRVLTEQWAEFVEEMLPPRIAPLFFFDGERIEQFADLESSAQVIATAVNALLGLDIVERLRLDLEVLERRKMAGAQSDAVRVELEAAERAVRDAEGQVQAQYARLGAARQLRDRRSALLERAREGFKAQGGELFGAREALAIERAQLEGALEGARKALRLWAGETAPLLLIEDLVRDTAAQAAREAAGDETRTVLAHLDGRDRRTLEALRADGAAEPLLARFEAFLEADRRALASRTLSEAYLSLGASARGAVEVLLADGFNLTRTARDELLAELEGFERQRDDLERKLASIPAPEAISPLLTAVAEAEAELAAAEAELAASTREHEAAVRALTEQRSAYQAKLDKHVQQRLQEEDTRRLVSHSGRARETLLQFRRQVVRHHVHQIERLILQALRELLSKEDLVVDVRIDPETFAIELRGGGWDALPPERLSAGERQLFAVALLWALAKASGQAAPTVIDTPLGRLDSKHRERLVERYFGRAGEQVILLSTDEEIDAKLFERLSPWLSRSFTVVYDAETRGSRVVPGYAFAAPTALEAA